MAGKLALIVAMLMGLPALSGLAKGHGAKPSTTPPAPGTQAPPLTLEKVIRGEGEACTGADPASFKGRVIVLEFWATWCLPCLNAIPHLNQLVDEFEGQPVEFISVTDEPERHIQGFLANKKLRGWVGLDADRSLFDAYQVQAIPRTFIVGQDNTLLASMAPEAVTRDVLHRAIEGKAIVVLDEFAHLPPADPAPPANSEGSGPVEPLFRIEIGPPNSRSSYTWCPYQGKLERPNLSLRELIAFAYHVPASRVTGSIPLNQRYDLLVYVPPAATEQAFALCQQAIQTGLGLQIRSLRQSIPVWVARVADTNGPGLVRASPGQVMGQQQIQSGEILMVNQALETLFLELEKTLDRPVIDETGLTGRYNVYLNWDKQDQNSILVALRERLGFALSRETRLVETLLVAPAPGDRRNEEP